MSYWRAYIRYNSSAWMRELQVRGMLEEEKAANFTRSFYVMAASCTFLLTLAVTAYLIFGGIWNLLFIGTVIFGVMVNRSWNGGKQAYLYSVGQESRGEVTAYQVRGNEDGWRRYEIYFRYTDLLGEAHTMRHRCLALTGEKEFFEVGQKIRIVYDPEFPKIASPFFAEQHRIYSLNKERSQFSEEERNHLRDAQRSRNKQLITLGFVLMELTSFIGYQFLMQL